MAKATVASNFMIVAAAVVLLMCSTVPLVFSVVPPPYITTRGPSGKGGDGDPSSPSSSSSKYRIYIVFLRPPPEADTMDDEALQSWYQSFLPSNITDSGEPRMVITYKTLFYGFAARLTEAELDVMSKKPGFGRSMLGDRVYHPQVM